MFGVSLNTLCIKNVCLNVNHTVNSLVKGTSGVISSDPPIVDWCFQFTPVPFNPLTAQGYRTFPLNYKNACNCLTLMICRLFII